MKPAMPTIIRGDARALPLPDASVDLICTSPPYFGLRDYGYTGQIGSEPTPAEFLAALLDVTAECARVLKPSGSMWINLGDKYNAYNGSRGDGTIQTNSVRQSVPKGHGLDVKDSRPKSLLLIPERYRIACTDDLGLICRAVLIWSKPNGLPESVTDRVRRSHEDWVHLTKQPRYYSAVDEIREPHAPGTAERYRAGYSAKSTHAGAHRPSVNVDYTEPFTANPLGKLPGSVWEIATQPLNVPASLAVDHFAAFPMEWPRRLILGWSPREVCTACGEGRRPVTEQVDEAYKAARSIVQAAESDVKSRGRSHHTIGKGTSSAGVAAAISNGVFRPDRRITGYTCPCMGHVTRTGTLEEIAGYTPPSTTPGVVLDPFGGTGTTALVATMLGRRGIGVDLSADYCRLAEWRATDPKERARAAGLDPDRVARVAPRNPEQGDLFAAPQPDQLDDEAAS